MKIAIIVFDDVEELDAIGPWEVFQTAARFNPSISCKMISMDGNGVTANKGLAFGVQGAMDHQEKYDVILLPGGQGTRNLFKNSAFQERLRFYLENAQWITSVCSGALIYAAMGLLKGKQCTSHHSVIELLQEIEPEVSIDTKRRFVQDGNMLTSAGVSAGIDMSLWLLGELDSVELAKQVQEHIEYFPEPPYMEK